MTLCVVDSSAVGPMLFDDEAQEIIPDLVAQFGEGAVLVPGHWHLEVTSMLQNAVRRRRIGAEQRTDAIAILGSFSVAVDDQTTARLWTETLPLADRHGLTIYDAVYLELARRTGASLATGDNDLRDAAVAENVRLLSK